MAAQSGAPPGGARDTGPTATGRGYLRLVWQRQGQAQTTIPAPAAQLTAQDRRFLAGLARWPLPLKPVQRAWLRHLAGGCP